MAVDWISLDGLWLLKDYAHKAGEADRPFEPDHPTDGWLPTPVPGDIHPTLAEHGRLPADIFYGQNVEQCKWTGRREWWFRRDFEIDAAWLRPRTELVFEGIDLFGGVWLNGRYLGETSNSFRPYRFDVTDVIRPGRNTLVVRVGATLEILEGKPWRKYFACFNTPRIFARKAQCQFSWDWAPHLPAVGIWRSVRLETFESGRIMDVAVRTRNDGHVTFFVELDERTERQDLDQKVTSKGQHRVVRPTGDLVFEIRGPVNVAGSRGQAGRKVASARFPVRGQKNFCTLHVPAPQLWWPNGLGDQPLYRYRVRLVRNGRTHHAVEGRFGIRQIRLLEEPTDRQRFSFTFEINGQRVFCKGANWVPASCFPATVPEERYRYLLGLARDAHFNMIRVWGGGIYEKDIFYDLCDELGLMVWQDFMFACSDYPDDDPAFLDLVIPELQYQVRRLRNHPSLVYWCGGNEKTGSAGFKIHYGERLFHVVARGVCTDLDPTRPYRPASPQSYTDLGNDQESGDTHAGCYEKAFAEDITRFRDKIAEIRTVFNSEFGLHGPVRYRSLVKFMPPEQIWPIGAGWEYHVQDNPYNSLDETFVQVQAKMARALMGDFDDAPGFIKCASAVHAEILRAELEYHRSRKWDNSGALLWMFNDCWPCASWSIVDYYGWPKPVYYAVRRSCRPVLATIVPAAGGYNVFVVNDRLEPVRVALEFGQGHVTEGLIWSKRRTVRVPANGSVLCATIAKGRVRRLADSFLFVRLREHHSVGPQTSGGKAGPSAVGGSVRTNPFFFVPWRRIHWPEPDLQVRAIGAPRRCRIAQAVLPARHEWRLDVELTAQAYARMVYLEPREDVPAWFSDNFFDLLPGESVTVQVRTPTKMTLDALRVGHWLTRWD